MATDDTIDALNDLIETSKDGETGFRNAYEHAQAPELKQVFLARAEDCRNAVVELQGLVSRLGGTPEDSGSLTEAMHRGWASAKGALAGYSALSLLEVCKAVGASPRKLGYCFQEVVGTSPMH